MPHYGSEETKEIFEIVEAVAKEVELGASKSELETMARQLLPHYGADLFRLLWSIPKSMKGFPSAAKIIERLNKGPVPPLKDHNFAETIKSVFGDAGGSHNEKRPAGPLTDALLDRNTAALIREGVDPAKAKAGADFIRKIFPVPAPPPTPPKLELELDLDLELELELPEENLDLVLDL